MRELLLTQAAQLGKGLYQTMAFCLHDTTTRATSFKTTVLLRTQVTMEFRDQWALLTVKDTMLKVSSYQHLHRCKHTLLP